MSDRENKARAWAESRYEDRLRRARLLIEHYDREAEYAREEVDRLLKSRDALVDWEIHRYKINGWDGSGETRCDRCGHAMEPGSNGFHQWCTEE